MKKQKKPVPLTRAPYFPFLCLLALMALLHLFLKLTLLDDGWFFQALGGTTYPAYIAMRWQTWTSRLVIETLLVYMVRLPILWKLIDIGAVMLLVNCISRLGDVQDDSSANYMLCAAFLWYPFMQLGDTGWAATTINYLWPGALAVYILYTLKLAWKGKLSVAHFILGILAALVADNAELYCAVLLAAGLIVNVLFLKSKKFNIYAFCQLLLAAAGLAVIALCPGNAARMASEIKTWYPSFPMLSILDKLYSGMQNTVAYLIVKGSPVYFLVCAFLCALIWKKERSPLFRVIAALPPAACVLGFAGRGLASFGAANFLNAYQYRLPGDGSLIPAGTYALFFVYLLSLLCFLACLYILFRDSWKAWACLLIFCAGLATGVVMGFSPTIYASNMRIFFPLNIACLLLFAAFMEPLKRFFGKDTRDMLMYGVALAGLVSFGVNLLLCMG